jgi:SAM-dependent methyltransferase
MDVESGDNVDCVLEDPKHWPFPDASFDAVISGQCFEHVEDLHAPFREMGRVLRYGGLACVIAPWCWSIHRYPRDCWRILPDGMQFLLEKHAGLANVRAFTIDVPLRLVAAQGNSLVGDYFIRKDGCQGEMRLGDFLLDSGVVLGDIVVQGDCVGLGVKRT